MRVCQKGVQAGPDLRQTGSRASLTFEAPVTSSSSMNRARPFL